MQHVEEAEGRFIARLCFDPDIVFGLEKAAVFDSADTLTLIISGSMVVHADGSEPFRLAGERGVYMNNLHRYSFAVGPVVRNCFVRESGALLLEFDNGSLEALPEADGEAWQMHADNGFRIICRPGGELAIWDAIPEEDPDDEPPRTPPPRRLDRPVELDDVWFLPLRHCPVARCLVDAATFALQFDHPHALGVASAPPAFTLRIGGPFYLDAEDGQPRYLQPPEGISPALRLAGEPVSKAIAQKAGGSLRAVFRNGAVLRVEMDEGQVWELVAHPDGYSTAEEPLVISSSGVLRVLDMDL